VKLPNVSSGACSTADCSNRPGHWYDYVRQVSCWTTVILIQENKK